MLPHWTYLYGLFEVNHRFRETQHSTPTDKDKPDPTSDEIRFTKSPRCINCN